MGLYSLGEDGWGTCFPHHLGMQWALKEGAENPIHLGWAVFQHLAANVIGPWALLCVSALKNSLHHFLLDNERMFSIPALSICCQAGTLSPPPVSKRVKNSFSLLAEERHTLSSGQGSICHGFYASPCSPSVALSQSTLSPCRSPCLPSFVSPSCPAGFQKQKPSFSSFSTSF